MKVSTLIIKLTEYLSENGDNNDVVLSINNIHGEHIFSNSDIDIVDYFDGTVGLYAHREKTKEIPEDEKEVTYCEFRESWYDNRLIANICTNCHKVVTQAVKHENDYLLCPYCGAKRKDVNNEEL